MQKIRRALTSSSSPALWTLPNCQNFMQKVPCISFHRTLKVLDYLYLKQCTLEFRVVVPTILLWANWEKMLQNFLTQNLQMKLPPAWRKFFLIAIIFASISFAGLATSSMGLITGWSGSTRMGSSSGVSTFHASQRLRI